MTLGYDPVAGKRYRKLKNMVDALQHLLSSYPIRLIRMSDLELIYKNYADSSPNIDAIIQRVIKYNKSGSDVFAKTADEVRKGEPLYDKFGVQLPSKGLGEWDTNKTLTLVGIAVIAYLLIRYRFV